MWQKYHKILNSCACNLLVWNTEGGAGSYGSTQRGDTAVARIKVTSVRTSSPTNISTNKGVGKRRPLSFEIVRQ